MFIRLIDTSTICLKPFVGVVPEYAILSHTWDPEGEISFQELRDANNISNHLIWDQRAFSKIVAMCWKARVNGIKYAWIDTCCIDKTSSAELSESINSMWKWYQQAQVCYVLLSDFEISRTEYSMANCRWFTRGWCLQEVLAPSSIEFFDKNWAYVGSKLSLGPVISQITNIPKEILADRSLIGSVPTAQKMSWAANRQTTREEDVAYCLLGIFEVNMPLLYGEGMNAFLRLQEEIIRRSNDRSIFAFPCNPSNLGADAGNNVSPRYPNLFATSPRDFLNCSDLKSTRSGTHESEAFTMTNKGLYFYRVEMRVDLQQGLFILPLNCVVGESGEIAMHLRKTGPGLYVKHDEPLERPEDTEKIYKTIEEAVYVSPKITSSLNFHLQKAETNAIHVVPTKPSLSLAVQPLKGAVSSNRWDPSRMLFFLSEVRSNVAFWRIFPSLAFQSVDRRYGLPAANFYLVSTVEPFDDNNNKKHLRAWVRLYTSDQWNFLESGAGALIHLDDFFKHEGRAEAMSRAQYDSTVVTATIEPQSEQNKPMFRLTLDFAFGVKK